jgi:hypothetical protein
MGKAESYSRPYSVINALFEAWCASPGSLSARRSPRSCVVRPVKLVRSKWEPFPSSSFGGLGRVGFVVKATALTRSSFAEAPLATTARSSSRATEGRASAWSFPTLNLLNPQLRSLIQL